MNRININWKPFIAVLLVGIFFAGCSDDEPETLADYIQESGGNSSSVIACAATGKENSDELFIYYYPVPGATNVRLFETDGNALDENDLSNYRLNTATGESAFGGKLGNFILTTGAKESFYIVSFEEDGLVLYSDPIRSRSASVKTNWDWPISIDQVLQGQPSFSWSSIENAVIYFQAIRENSGNFTSGTYTIETQFQYGINDNVVLNINETGQPALKQNTEYNLTLMGVGEENWVFAVGELLFDVK